MATTPELDHVEAVFVRTFSAGELLRNADVLSRTLLEVAATDESVSRRAAAAAEAETAVDRPNGLVNLANLADL
jgi:hypothetical protein